MKENLKKHLGCKVKALRESADLTQEELSVICDVSWRTISNLERGLVIPDLLMIIKIAHYFHTSIDELLAFENPCRKSQARLEKEIALHEKIKLSTDRSLDYLSHEIDLISKYF